MRSSLYILVAVFLFFFVSRLEQDGLSPAGAAHAAISNNLAHGVGTFWAPSFSKILFPEYYGHPPMMYGIQSLFFKTLGDGFATERVYGLFMLVLTLLLIALIWFRFFKNTTFAQHWPVPLVIWMLNPDIILHYTGNLPVCTMTVFNLLAVWLLLIKWPVHGDTGSTKPAWLFLGGAALAMVCGLLTGGLAACSPLAFFGIVFGIKKEGLKTAAAFTGGLLLLFLAVYGMFLLNEKAVHNQQSYFAQLLLPDFQGLLYPNTPQRGYLLLRVLETQIHWLVIGGLLWLGMRRQKGALEVWTQKPLAFAFLTGFIVLIPVFFIPQQLSHHLVPAMPWIALGVAVWYVGLTGKWSSYKTPAVVDMTAILLMFAATGWVIFQKDKTLPENAVLLNEVKEMCRVIPPGDSIAYVDPTPVFAFTAYFQRFNNSSLDNDYKDYKYLIVPKKATQSDGTPVFFKLLPLETKRYDLYMRR